ncbi:LexA family transcriptional regulator [Flavobacterium sp.]|uniref:LexA family transcriptional regulator n=1 Tax=Flavobacterium sp. TaxID=239 RepID=UPI0039E6B716
MQENNSLNANLILKKLKKALKISTDIQLSEFLNIKPNTISTWKKRNSLDYASIIAICELYEIDLNDIFFEKKNPKKDFSNYTSETPLVSREVQFQYCIGSAGILESLPKYNFPFVRAEETRAFQVLSNNMFPIIEENSFAVCESCEIGTISENSLVVIVSKAKGLFINRIQKSEKPDTFILSSENAFFNNVSIHISEINEIWLIKGILSYNINNENKIQFINDSLKKIDQAVAKNVE